MQPSDVTPTALIPQDCELFRRIRIEASESVLSQDLLTHDLSILRHIGEVTDRNGESVTASLMGLAKRKAIFRRGRGCTLVIDLSEPQLRSQSHPVLLPRSCLQPDQLWPVGEFVDSVVHFSLDITFPICVYYM